MDIYTVNPSNRKKHPKKATTANVLDCEVLSRDCKNCALHIPLKETNPAVYEGWKVDHEGKCHLNHEGSTSSMESAAAVAVFSRSVKSYGLRYTKYYGGGDSSSFSMVENIYQSTKIVKYECLGHYQKRVGNRLGKLRQHVKGLGGKDKTTEIAVTKKAKGKLTDASIDILQNYFGIALRSGAKSVRELKNALLASFVHVSSSEDCNFHTYCPAAKDTWCQYQRDLINGTNLERGFHDNVIKHVKPGYAKLTDESELAKCLHGQTQNTNGSFNSLLWERAPKIRNCRLMKLKWCVTNAISHFNYGGQSILDTLKLLNIDAGNTTMMVSDMNIVRKYNAGYKVEISSKQRRKVIRGFKKKKSDSIKKNEGVRYESGGFSGCICIVVIV